jgi:hypothetical protein
MSEKPDWKLLSARRGSDDRITLHVATPGGAVRDVPISDLQATVLIRDLASILIYRGRGDKETAA